MAIEIKVPDIGADEVEITEILVKVGDKVEAEQSLITVEGDKASMEVPSPQAGIVKEIKVSVGDKTQTGALIMIFDSRRCSRRCTCSGRREERNSSGSSTSGCSGKRR
ncbi:biotin/lipoyl-containing protein [Escherichia coli]